MDNTKGTSGVSIDQRHNTLILFQPFQKQIKYIKNFPWKFDILPYRNIEIDGREFILKLFSIYISWLCPFSRVI